MFSSLFYVLLYKTTFYINLKDLRKNLWNLLQKNAQEIISHKLENKNNP